MEKNKVQLKSLSVEQKTGFVLLLVFGFLAAGIGFLQMRNNIYSPFVVRTTASGFESTSYLDESLRLQQIDTDFDGLSDYDELEYFGTSPYLPDTDSDGFSDSLELENDTNPLCAEGESCGVIEPPKQEAQAESGLLEQTNPLDLLNIISQPSSIGGLGSIGGDPQTEQDLMEIVNSPEMLRTLLLSTGQITEEQLSKVDDETLLELVKNLNLDPTSVE